MVDLSKNSGNFCKKGVLFLFDLGVFFFLTTLSDAPPGVTLLFNDAPLC